MFGPKTAIFAPKYVFWAHLGLAGSFGALLFGWFVVVARGLYLAFLLYSVIGQVWSLGSYFPLLHLQPAAKVQSNMRPFSWQNDILACE